MNTDPAFTIIHKNKTCRLLRQIFERKNPQIFFNKNRYFKQIMGNKYVISMNYDLTQCLQRMPKQNNEPVGLVFNFRAY